MLYLKKILREQKMCAQKLKIIGEIFKNQQMTEKLVEGKVRREERKKIVRCIQNN